MGRLVEGSADHAFIGSCLDSDAELYDFYNALALHIAKSFIEGALSFEEADGAINVLNVIWTRDLAVSIDSFPEPGYSVYIAFDEGEYSIDGKDHIELYTKPELKKLLESS